MKFLAVGAALSLGLAACGGDSKGESSTTASNAASGKTLKVPSQYKTITAAVSAAKSGDMVLIGPGVYKETVRVETPRIVIRGENRNQVIVDGEFKRENGFIVLSDGVAVENLTVRNNTKNGVYFTGDYDSKYTLKGYRASYITAYDNGLYGIYAFNANDGQFDHDYASGHPDSGYYVGQCEDCNALLTDLVAENNMLGYSGTNSTGVTIVNSRWENNRAGIVPNSGYSEKLYPNRGTTIVGNKVINNNSKGAPNSESVAVAFGNGIVLGGVSNQIVERNYVADHANAGIVITDLPETTNPASNKKETFKPEKNKVTNNTLKGNQMDLAFLTVHYPSAPFGNCFADNKPASTYPADLEKKMPCTGTAVADLGDLSGIISKLVPPTPDVDYRTVPAPADQENMPNATTAKAVPATNVPEKVDVAAIKTPTP